MHLLIRLVLLFLELLLLLLLLLVFQATLLLRRLCGQGSDKELTDRFHGERMWKAHDRRLRRRWRDVSA